MGKLIVLSLAAMSIFGLACENATTTSVNANNGSSSNENIAVAANSNQTEPAKPAEAPNDAPRINLADAKSAFDAGDAYFIDTRAAAAYNVEHIKGAVNISPDKLAEKIGDIPKNKKIIAYCS